MSCNIRLNGEPRTVKAHTTLALLIEELGLPRDGVAVAVDLQVVPRSELADRVLRDGEHVEVIRAVGGG